MKTKEMVFAVDTLRYMGLEGIGDGLDQARKELKVRSMDAASVRSMVKLLVHEGPYVPVPLRFCVNKKRIGISWKYEDDSSYEILFDANDAAYFSAKVDDGSDVHVSGWMHAAAALKQLNKFLEGRMDVIKLKRMTSLDRKTNKIEPPTGHHADDKPAQAKEAGNSSKEKECPLKDI